MDNDEKARVEKRGKNIMKKMMEMDGVNGLQSLPMEWRDALVPKESTEGSKLFSTMCDMDSKFHQCISGSKMRSSTISADQE